MNKAKKTLNPGEKYLSIQVDAASVLYACHKAIQENTDVISLVAFKNKTKEGSQPDYHSSNCAVWINTKKETEQPPVTEETV